MKRSGFLKRGLCALAVLGAAAVFAEDDAEQEQPAADAQAEAGAENGGKAPGADFFPMVKCFRPRGSVRVMNPDHGKFEPAVSDKMYPLGTQFETAAGSSVTIFLSEQDHVILQADTLVSVKQGAKPEMRVIAFSGGQIFTFIRDTTPEGLIEVQTPNAALTNVAGKGDYTLKTAAGDESFRIVTITGSVSVKGQQYSVPALRAANTLLLVTEADRSMSRLTSESGEFAVVLEKGAEEPVSFKMSPRAVVKIWRQHAKIGGRLIVSTLAVNPNGVSAHRFAWAEGRPQVATGEMIQSDETAADEAAKEGGETLPVLLPKAKEKPAEGEPQPAGDVE